MLPCLVSGKGGEKGRKEAGKEGGQGKTRKEGREEAGKESKGEEVVRKVVRDGRGVDAFTSRPFCCLAKA